MPAKFRVSGKTPSAVRSARRQRQWAALLALLLLAILSPAALGQKGGTPSRRQKLPAPDKIILDYLKAIGGKKRVVALRDAIYEWSMERGGQSAGRARSYEKSPTATRLDLLPAGGELNYATNARSAWLRNREGDLRTLTGNDADTLKLHAALAAGRLVNYKKQDVAARTIDLQGAAHEGESIYQVEFTRRNGARLSYNFGVSNKLLMSVFDNSQKLAIYYDDYRPVAGGLLVSHRIGVKQNTDELFTLLLQNIRYNTGLSDALFEPPGDESLNLAELLRAVARNQDEVDERVSDYTFTRKETEREIDDKGVVKKEKTLIHEIYPVTGGGRVLKLISENGVPLSLERMAKEERRVAEALEKIERENAKRKEKQVREQAARARKDGETGAGAEGDSEVGIGVFLRACEFVSPRRERFQSRDAIVFDFRPRPNFKPANRGESIVAKLAGVAWIDPVDKQVMRLEARLSENFKVGGGLLASVRSGSAVALEQTRLADGVWLPRFSQINASAKIFLFAGFRLDATREYSNYKRFSTNVGDATVDQPKEP
ncbi:MAG: hypothetical protein ACR2G4_13205 [Pyrinomonadaceae bacterium]